MRSSVMMLITLIQKQYKQTNKYNNGNSSKRAALLFSRQNVLFFTHVSNILILVHVTFGFWPEIENLLHFAYR